MRRANQSFENANNYILLFLSAYIPFITTFKNAFFKYLQFDFLTIFLVFYYLVNYNFLNEKPVSKIKSPIISSMTIIIFLSIISALSGHYLDLAFEQVIRDIEFILIFIVVNKMIIGEKSISNIYKGVLAGFVLAVAIALLQHLGYQKFNIYSYGELNENTSYTTLDKTIDAVRVWGPFDNALTFSEYLSVAGLILYVYARLVLKNIVLAALFLGITIYCISLTISRTALAAFLLGVFLNEYIKFDRFKRFMFISFFLFAAFSAVLYVGPELFLSNSNPLISRMLSANDDLSQGRLDFWIIGFRIFTNNILFGTGPGNLHYELSTYGFTFPNETYSVKTSIGQHVENYYLTILYTYGIFVFIYYFKIYYCLIKYSFKSFKEYKNGDSTFKYCCFLFAPLIVLCVNSITNPALIFDQRIQLLFILLSASINYSYRLYKLQTKFSI